MTAVEAPITADAKRGFCGNCRRGSHALCTASMCTCTAREGHLNRPIGSQHRMPTGPSTLTRSPMPTPTKPVERATPPQIMWADPPAPRASARKIETAILDALRARAGHWARVKSYDKKTSAWGAAKGINKGSLGPGFEARGVATKAGSELYVRFVGK